MQICSGDYIPCNSSKYSRRFPIAIGYIYAKIKTINVAVIGEKK
jgi:hypothetical protein